jgi:hypothetical protein
MNGKQRAVLWIGLILVALNLAKNWSSIRSIIFSGAGGAVNSPSGDPSSGGISVVPGIPASPGGGVTLPFGGFPITIPLPSGINDPISQSQKDIGGRVAQRSPTGTVSGSRL